MADITLFPAHAGVILTLFSIRCYVSTFPRTRGGDPKAERLAHCASCFSPHTRG